ncbi:hypothetical protein TorRG33x02_186760 [Trema orientale]|uniref:Uncharacterized protein n=1 Tax=Trema orientale TaxID=63057 RepID=A0A2P5EJ04_TREOI|nr:hypothetical protein TorRG33x02_186760 [Trema orientale]
MVVLVQKELGTIITIEKCYTGQFDYFTFSIHFLTPSILLVYYTRRQPHTYTKPSITRGKPETTYYGIKCEIEACISSKLRPFVSGTSFATKRTVKPPMAPKMKKVPAVA